MPLWNLGDAYSSFTLHTNNSHIFSFSFSQSFKNYGIRGLFLKGTAAISERLPKNVRAQYITSLPCSHYPLPKAHPRVQLTLLSSLCSAFQPTSCVVSILWSPVMPHSVAMPPAASHSEPHPKAPWVPALSHVLGPTVGDWLSHHHWPLVALHVVGGF